jgi:hypothetical protein
VIIWEHYGALLMCVHLRSVRATQHPSACACFPASLFCGIGNAERIERANVGHPGYCGTLLCNKDPVDGYIVIVPGVDLWDTSMGEMWSLFLNALKGNQRGLSLLAGEVLGGFDATAVSCGAVVCPSFSRTSPMTCSPWMSWRETKFMKICNWNALDHGLRPFACDILPHQGTRVAVVGFLAPQTLVPLQTKSIICRPHAECGKDKSRGTEQTVLGLQNTKWHAGKTIKIPIDRLTPVLDYILTCQSSMEPNRLYLTDMTLPDYEAQGLPLNIPGKMSPSTCHFFHTLLACNGLEARQNTVL